MKKREFIYRCGKCGHEEPKWLGRCPECGEWNSLAECAPSPASGKKAYGGQAASGKAGGTKPLTVPLSAVALEEGKRISSGIGELDRVLGGGIMKQSAVLLGGEPGIGKSTLLLQAAARAEVSGRVLYISGEESAGQVRMRAERLGLRDSLSRIEICCTGELSDVLAAMEASRPVLVMADSAQTLRSAEAGPAPGTVSQLKLCSWELIDWVKEHDAALFLAAHVTKDGLISGPKTLEHMVDTVLYFDQGDSPGGGCRFLRAVKNRFGSVDEIGIFTMGEDGLSPVADPSQLFLVRREGPPPAGIVTAAVLEGTRVLLAEIQTLTVPAKGAVSRVFSGNIEQARVSRVAAALEKHLGLRLSDQDLYVNIAGGLKINEVGVELALAAALYSARTGLPVPADAAVAGELSLAGEAFPARRMESRIKTALGLGFARVAGPEAPYPVKDLAGMVKQLFAPEGGR